MNNPSILITGGCGFIGTNLIRALIQHKLSPITIVDRKPKPGADYGAGKDTDLEFVQLDIRSPELASVLAHRQVNTVVHLAALHYIPYCEQHPEEAWEVNVRGTEAVLTACATHRVERFFMASTAAVYKSSSSPHVEEDPLEAMDVYGRTKVANEQQVRAAAGAGEGCYAIGRLFNAVGAFETNPHLIPEIIKRIQVSNRIEIGNTESRRDYIHVRDVCSGIIKIILGLDSKLEICNIGSGESYSVKEVVERLSGIIGRPLELIPSERLQRRVDRPMLVANNTRLREKYAWSPRYSFDEALRDALDFGDGSRLKPTEQVLPT